MLKGTKVLWPEKEPYLYLMKELIEMGRKAFMKEKQNEPISSNDALFDEIWWYHEDASKGGFVIEKTGVVVPYDDMEAYGALDPATGESKSKSKGKLDFTCILSGYKDLKGRLFVHRDFTKRAKPTEYIKQIFEAYETMPFQKFVVETNLFRNLLIENLVRERRERESERKKNGVPNWGLRIPFYEIENRDKKEKRIFTLEPKVSNGFILFNRALGVEFMNQVQEFPLADHDDGPDALEMLWGLINNRYKPSPLNVDAMGNR
jgi:predicted phage terminase large subunit-like protein